MFHTPIGRVIHQLPAVGTFSCGFGLLTHVERSRRCEVTDENQDVQIHVTLPSGRSSTLSVSLNELFAVQKLQAAAKESFGIPYLPRIFFQGRMLEAQIADHQVFFVGKHFGWSHRPTCFYT